MNQLVNLRCVILRGAFPGERVFQIVQSDGETYEGTAPEHYFRKLDGGRLSTSEPKPEGKLNGVISVVRLRESGDDVRVALPDNEAISVSSSVIASQLTENELVPV